MDAVQGLLRPGRSHPLNQTAVGFRFRNAAVSDGIQEFDCGRTRDVQRFTANFIFLKPNLIDEPRFQKPLYSPSAPTHLRPPCLL